jgi:hypothetical protein
VLAAELRRIERDLHDGAQARLVALTVQIGRAEGRLEDRPEVAELLRSARAEATAAIAELRDLARAAGAGRPRARGGRGCARPLLGDPRDGVRRGAASFAAGRGDRRLLRGRRVADERRRARAARVRARRAVGGGQPSSSRSPATARAARTRAATGLSGLRQRVQALDGRLAIVSNPREGT